MIAESKTRKGIRGKKNSPFSKNASSAKDIISQLKQVPGTRIIRKKSKKRKK